MKAIGHGNLHTGVKLENGATIRIQLEFVSNTSYPLSLSINDNRIILTAYLLQEQGEKVVFVSKDFAARIKAEALGISAEDYKNLKYSYDSIYKGINQASLSKHDIDLFYKDGKIAIPDLSARRANILS